MTGTQGDGKDDTDNAKAREIKKNETSGTMDGLVGMEPDREAGRGEGVWSWQGTGVPYGVNHLYEVPVDF